MREREEKEAGVHGLTASERYLSSFHAELDGPPVLEFFTLTKTERRSCEHGRVEVPLCGEVGFSLQAQSGVPGGASRESPLGAVYSISIGTSFTAGSHTKRLLNLNDTWAPHSFVAFWSKEVMQNDLRLSNDIDPCLADLISLCYCTGTVSLGDGAYGALHGS